VKILRLVVPGLLGPCPVDAGFPRPEVPALERLLSRAEPPAPAPVNADATLFDLFGLPAVGLDGDLPVAAVTRLVDAGDAAGNWWLRADPVHLRADLRRIVLQDARCLGIDVNEAQALVAALNAAFAADGLTLDAPYPSRWYLPLPEDPGLRTHALAEAGGQEVHPLLPEGPGGRRFRTLLTEIQMFLHDHAVNRRRAAHRLPVINSVWFWGGGKLPQGARSPSDGVYASDPLTWGLARLAGVAVNPLPAHAGDWRAAAEGETDVLVVLEDTRYDHADNNLYAWTSHVNALETSWFAPVLAMLRSGELETLLLYSCDGRMFRIGRGGFWQFWRRVKPLTAYFSG
jgi:hypothetical protein